MNLELALMRDEKLDAGESPLANVALELADEILSYAAVKPNLCPDQDGGIAMEWGCGRRLVRMIIRVHGKELNRPYIYSRDMDEKTGEVFDYQRKGNNILG